MTRMGIVVVALLVVAALAWSAAEQHYRSCVVAAEARTPVVVTTHGAGSLGSNGLGGGLDSNGVTVGSMIRGSVARSKALRGCSRLP
jgi:hypothetical protein